MHASIGYTGGVKRAATDLGSGARHDTSPAGLPPALIRSTVFLVRQVSRRADDLLADALAPLGLRARHFAILAALAEGGPTSQHGLGQQLGVDRTTMVSAVDDLEQRRLVVRQPDPADRRAYRVELTTRGRTTLVRATGAVGAAEAGLLAPLSPDERTMLATLLHRIAHLGASSGEDADAAPSAADAAERPVSPPVAPSVHRLGQNQREDVQEAPTSPDPSRQNRHADTPG